MSHPNFAPLQLESTARIAAARGQFGPGEGKGRRTHDFTVTISKRRRRKFAAAGIDPDWLEVHPIRLRGWIEQHSGLVIKAVAPQRIELAK